MNYRAAARRRRGSNGGISASIDTTRIVHVLTELSLRAALTVTEYARYDAGPIRSMNRTSLVSSSRPRAMVRIRQMKRLTARSVVPKNPRIPVSMAWLI